MGRNQFGGSMAWRSRKQNDVGAPAKVPADSEASIDVTQDGTAIANPGQSFYSAIRARKVGAQELQGGVESSNAAILARARRVSAQARKATIGTEDLHYRDAQAPASDRQLQSAQSVRQSQDSVVRTAPAMLREVMTPVGLSARSVRSGESATTLADGAPLAAKGRVPEAEVAGSSPHLSRSFLGPERAPAPLFPGRNCHLSGYRTAAAPAVGASLSVGLQARWERRLLTEQIISPDRLDRVAASTEASNEMDGQGGAVIDLRDGKFGSATPMLDAVASVRIGSGASRTLGGEGRPDVRKPVAPGSSSGASALNATDGGNDRVPGYLGDAKVFATVRKSAWVIDPLRRVGVMLATPGSKFQVVHDGYSSTNSEDPASFVEILLEENVRLIPRWAFFPKSAQGDCEPKTP